MIPTSQPLQPHTRGRVQRNGISVPYSVFGDGPRTVLLMPPWSLVHSRVWKMQVPYLATRHRVITVEPRGAGGADAPTHARDYAEAEIAADCLAVLDACEVERCTIVSVSRSAQRALLLATEHPERVEAAVFISPMFPVTRASVLNRLAFSRLMSPLFRAPALPAPGRLGVLAARYNARAWRRDLPGFIRWFWSVGASMPYSSRVWEEAVEWSLGTDPEMLIRSWVAPLPSVRRRAQFALADRVRCPVLVISGTGDLITPHDDARALARATGGQLHAVHRGDHVVQVRKPVEVTVAVDRFVGQLPGGQTRADAAPGSPGRSAARSRRVLYVSSPIGLGHARRDLSIVRHLRELHQGVVVDWLAEDPVTRILRGAGERIHPLSDRLASESGHWTAVADGHRLHALEAFRAMNEINLLNYMIFREAVTAERYDLVIADEGWFVDYYLHENPGDKQFAYAWLADFIGVVPVPEDGPTEIEHALEWNRQMVEHVEGSARVRDLSVFVGDVQDVVDLPLAPELPSQRTWAAGHFCFPGYVHDEPGTTQSGARAQLRAQLGWGPEPVCVAAVGGSGIGTELLARAAACGGELRTRLPGCRMVVVTGPRIDPGSIPGGDGVEILGFVPDLPQLLAAADLAVIQGGLTTAMELVAARRPFVYVPLTEHFEQQVHVHHRLMRYEAGRRLQFADADPRTLAEALGDEYHRGPDGYRPVEPGAARRVAARLAELL